MEQMQMERNGERYITIQQEQVQIVHLMKKQEHMQIIGVKQME